MGEGDNEPLDPEDSVLVTRLLLFIYYMSSYLILFHILISVPALFLSYRESKLNWTYIMGESPD